MEGGTGGGLCKHTSLPVKLHLNEGVILTVVIHTSHAGRTCLEYYIQITTVHGIIPHIINTGTYHGIMILQGSVLRPVLFTIYINNIGLSINIDRPINQYADDTVMYAIAPTVDQPMLELQSDFVTLQNALVDLNVYLMRAKRNILYVL
jgi:hypothetical protein